MNDVDLTKKLLNKSLYVRLHPYIKEWSVSALTWDILKGIGEYFKSYPEEDTIDLDKFQTFFFAIFKTSMKGEKHALFTTYFTKLRECDEASTLVEDVLKNFITKDYATKIFHTASDMLADKAGICIDDIAALTTQYNREVGRAVTKTDLFVPTSLSYLTETCGSAGFEWRLNEINMALGPLRTGDFVIVAARPETGKTTFVASEVSNFLPQLTDDRPIMWVNNEESSGKVMYRVIQSYFGVPVSTLSADIKRYEDEFNAMCKGRFQLISDDAAVNDVKGLNILFEEYNPAMIIFDQLDKVDGFHKSEREDLRIGSLYEWARSLAKKYGPVIAISQVDGTGEGVKWIDKNQLRGSKTDKIGEADAIITIGTTKEEGHEYERYLHFPKNKLYGGPKSEEIHRHGHFTVNIVPHLVRYEGVF